jgi:hypothetical protein
MLRKSIVAEYGALSELPPLQHKNTVRWGENYSILPICISSPLRLLVIRFLSVEQSYSLIVTEEHSGLTGSKHNRTIEA